MDDVHNLRFRALQDIKIGQFAGAIDKLRDLLTIDPENALAHVLLASCLMQQRRLHAARHEADLAIQLRPDMSFAHRMRGSIAHAENDLVRMGEAMHRAVELDPDEVDMIIALAHFHKANGDTDMSRQLAVKALEMEPDYIDALLLDGELALARGDIDRAHHAAQACLKADPESIEALVLLGRAKLRQRDVGAARDLVLWALQLDADDQHALALLTDIKMSENKLLGVFWWFHTKLAGLGPERAMIVLICGFVVYSLARVALYDFGYGLYGNLLTGVWLALCLYTWAGAGIRDRMVAKELQRVRLRPEF